MVEPMFGQWTMDTRGSVVVLPLVWAPRKQEPKAEKWWFWFRSSSPFVGGAKFSEPEPIPFTWRWFLIAYPATAEHRKGDGGQAGGIRKQRLHVNGLMKVHRVWENPNMRKLVRIWHVCTACQVMKHGCNHLEGCMYTVCSFKRAYELGAYPPAPTIFHSKRKSQPPMAYTRANIVSVKKAFRICHHVQ